MKQGWTYKTLGDITASMADGPFGSNLKKEHYTNRKEVRIIQLSNIGEDGWREENTKYTTFEHLDSIQRSEVLPGDIVIAKMMPAGRAILCPSHEAKFVLSSDAVRATLKEGVNRRFILYSINSPYFRKQVYENVSGSGRVRTSLTKLRACKIGIPPISEQERIVEQLDAAFAQIDELKNNAGRQLAEARALFQSALTQAMQPKPGWQEKKLKEIGLTQTGTTPPKSDADNYGDFIPFIRPAEIDIDTCGSINYESEVKLSQKGLSIGRIFYKHSILMVCIGTIGKVGFTTQDVSCNQQINVLSPNKEYHYKFIYYAMRNDAFQQEVIKVAKSAQATLPIINKSKWESLSIYLPSYDEQSYIATYLDFLSDHVRELEKINRVIIAECDAFKQALLRQIFE